MLQHAASDSASTAAAEPAPIRRNLLMENMKAEADEQTHDSRTRHFGTTTSVTSTGYADDEDRYATGGGDDENDYTEGVGDKEDDYTEGGGDEDEDPYTAGGSDDENDYTEGVGDDSDDVGNSNVKAQNRASSENIAHEKKKAPIATT